MKWKKEECPSCRGLSGFKSTKKYIALNMQTVLIDINK